MLEVVQCLPPLFLWIFLLRWLTQMGWSWFYWSLLVLISSFVWILLPFTNSLFVLGLHCCAGFSLVVARGGCSLIAERQLLAAVASRAVEHGLQACEHQQLQHAGLVVAALGLSCPKACGIFPDRGSDPCLLHWQMDSLPLSHQGSPLLSEFLISHPFSLISNRTKSYISPLPLALQINAVIRGWGDIRGTYITTLHSKQL